MNAIAPKYRRRRSRAPLMMALEPRFLFDGAGVATIVDAAHQSVHPTTTPHGPDPLAEALANHVLAVDPTAGVSAPTQVRAADPAHNGGKREAVFVDTSVSDWQALANGVRAGVEVELIDGGQSGLAQMAKWAESHTGYDAIHLLSQGGEATLRIGSDTVTSAGLATPVVQVELAEIGHALNPGGEVLLYGSNIARGGDGQTLLADLAACTGSMVAAADHAVGDAGHGGGWTLDVATDSRAVTPLAVAGYRGTLEIGAHVTDSALEPVQVQAADAARDGGKLEVAFVDSSVAGWQGIVSGLQSSRPGLEIELIDGTQSGLAQMVAWADTHHGYDAIHVVSQGAEGALKLGTDTLADTSLSNTVVRVDLRVIGWSLKPGGEMLFYGADIAAGADGQTFVTDLAARAGVSIAAPNGAGPADSAALTLADTRALGGAVAAEAIQPATAAGNPHQVVVVDGTVVDWQTLVAGMDPSIPVIVLVPDANGRGELAELAAALSNFHDLDAIHLVTEGRGGGVLLFGQEALWSGDLQYAGADIAAIRGALKPGGSLALYGCSVANNDHGKQFINDLAADLGNGIVVEASTDKTGPTALGGDWDLEYSTGVAETVLPFTLAGMQDISHCLGCVQLDPTHLSGPDGVTTWLRVVPGYYTYTLNYGVHITNGGYLNHTYFGPNTKIDIFPNNGEASGMIAVVDECNGPVAPTITSATYDESTHTLAVTGSNMTANDVITATKLTLTGTGGATYTLAGSYTVTASSATAFSLTLTGADIAGVEALLDKNGTTASDSTTFNLAAADDWDANVTNGDTSVAIVAVTVSKVPTITSAAYNASTGVLTVTGTDFQAKTGATNDISVGKLTLKGEGAATYTLTASDVEITGATGFSVTLNATDRATVDTLLNKNGTASFGGTTFNLAAADDWCANHTAGNLALATIGVTVSNVSAPTVTSATYDASSGALVVTGTGLLHKGAGGNDDIVANKLTITGEGGTTYTLTDTSNADVTDSSHFTLTLSATDKAALNQLMNKAGTSSTGGTTYNLAVANNWEAAYSNAADLTLNGVTVSNVAVPAITSATYNEGTGALVVTGTGFLKLNGATNDIDVSKLSITGQGGTSYTLTSASVEITSGTSFSVTLNAADKLAVNALLNKAGTVSVDTTTYNLAAAEDWAAGADSAVVVADLAGNGITASNLQTPTVTSAVYNQLTGELTVTGTNLLGKTGAANDIDVTLLTITGQAGATFTLTANTTNVEIDSATQFTVTLGANDKTSVDLLLNAVGTQSSGGTTYNVGASDGWMTDWAGNGVNTADATSGITVAIPPTITSATYDATTGTLVVTGSTFQALGGATNDIDVTKLTLTGEGGATFTLTNNTSNVEIESATQFTVILGATDKAALNQIMNKAGTASTGTTTYNLAGAANWDAGFTLSGAADATNGVTVSAVPVPTITSATYDASTGVVVVTGTGFLKLAGATNDIDVSKLAFRGEGGGNPGYTFTTSGVEIDSATQFTIHLNATDWAAVNLIMNKNGVSSTSADVYLIRGLEDWNAGAEASVTIADTVNNTVTVSNVSAPAITSATYDASTGSLVVTGTGFTRFGTGGTDDILANTLSFVGEGGGGGYTLTNTSNVDVTSPTSFTLTLSATDQAALNLILNKNGTTSTSGTTYNLVAAAGFDKGDSTTAADGTNAVTVSNVAVPAITSAAYDYSANTLTFTGTGFLSKAGATNDIDTTKLTITGEGGATYTLVSSANVEVTSGTSFTVTLTGADLYNVERLLDQNGTTALTSATTFNVAAAAGWNRGDSTSGADDTNTITVSNWTAPTVTSATYDASTGVLTVTGTDLVNKSGATNDIDATLLTLAGEGGSYTLTAATAAVELTSATSFSVTLGAVDKLAIDGLLNKNGTLSSGGATYNLAAAANWDAGSPAGAADLTLNGVTVGNVQTPTITSSTYNANTGVLTVTATNLFAKVGATNDIDVTKLTLKGAGNGTYALTADTSNVEVTSATSFTVTLGSTDKAQINALLDTLGTSSGAVTYNLAAADHWLAGADSATNIQDLAGNGVTVTIDPAITSATYNASTGALVLTGTNFQATGGALNDIVANKLTLTGEGGATYTLTDTANVEFTSATAATLTLSATDKAALNLIFNKSGTTSTDSTTYNVAAAAGWDAATATATDTTTPVTASSVSAPAITSATYNASTGALVLTGTDFVHKSGANNDIVANKLTLTGEGGDTYTLTDTANVEITSGTSATLTLSATDKAALNMLFNKNGTASTNNTTYNLAAAAGFDQGDSTSAADASNGVTVSAVAAPTITSATYDASTGTLVATGTGFVHKAGATNDIQANKITLTGEGGSYTLTDTADVEVTSPTSFTLTLSATDKAALTTAVNKDGTSSNNSTTYNLAAAAGFDRGDSTTAADLTNAVTASNTNQAPTAGAATVSNSGTVGQSFAFNSTGLTVQITYSDVDGNLNAGTIDTSDLTITRTSGSGSAPVVTGVSTSTSGNSITATYTLKPASGATWSDAFNGSFRIDLAGSQVSDSGTPSLSAAAASGVATFTVAMDTTAPAAPSQPSLASSSDSGWSNSDGITTATTPTFGGTAEAGSTVKLYDGSTLVATTTAGGDGHWSVATSALGAGSHTITARATDAAGNTGSYSGGQTIVVETAAPNAIAGTLVVPNRAGTGTEVGTVSANDPGGQALHYDLTDDAGGRFVIDQNTGKVSLNSALSYDYTSTGQYPVTVRVTNAAGLTRSETISVKVTLSSPPPPPPPPPATPTVSTAATISTGTAPTGTTAPTIGVGTVGATDTGAGNSGSRLITTGAMNGGSVDTGAGNSGSRLITTSNMNSPASGSMISNASSTGTSVTGSGSGGAGATFSESLGGNSSFGGGSASLGGGMFSGLSGSGSGFSSSGFSGNPSGGTGATGTSGTGAGTGANPSSSSGFNTGPGSGPSTTGGTGLSTTTGTGGLGGTGSTTGTSSSGATTGGDTSGRSGQGQGSGQQQGETNGRDRGDQQGQDRGQQGQGQTRGQQGQPQGERGQQGPEQGQPQQPGERAPNGEPGGDAPPAQPEPQPHAWLFGPATRSFSEQLADASGKFERDRLDLLRTVRVVASLNDRAAA